MVLLHRGGFFHAAHARLPGRDNLVHRVDPDPANPFEYAFTDGSELKVTPNLTGTYSYKDPQWLKLMGDYDSGKLVIRYLEEVPPLTWDEATGRLSGTLDVWILPVDEANGWGLSPPANIQAHRIRVSAEAREGRLAGTCEAWTYGGADMSFGMRAKRATFAASGALANHVLVRRGADPELVARRRHALFCFDARTGRTPWRWMSPGFDYQGSSGKSGEGLTPCVIGDRVFARVNGITCFDANTGAIVWQRDEPGFSIGGGWSHEESLVAVDGVLIVISGSVNLLGVNPATGERLWSQANVTGPNQLAAPVVLNGKTYIAVAYGAPVGDQGGQAPRLSLIDPHSGKLLWQDANFGINEVSLLVSGNLVCGNASADGRNTGACEVSVEGARKLWETGSLRYPEFRATPAASKGYFYIDTGDTGFQAPEALAGPLQARVDQHDETWQLDLARKGDELSGTCRRTVPPLAAPAAVAGAVGGQVENRPDGSTWWIFSCDRGISQQPQDPGFERQTVHIVVCTRKDGSRHAWARAGKVNRSTHEVDASALTIEGGAARGKVTVVYHGDAYVSANPETKSALAAAYELETTIMDGKIAGTCTGTLGIGCERVMAAAGQYRPNQDVSE